MEATFARCFVALGLLLPIAARATNINSGHFDLGFYYAYLSVYGDDGSSLDARASADFALSVGLGLQASSCQSQVCPIGPDIQVGFNGGDGPVFTYVDASGTAVFGLGLLYETIFTEPFKLRDGVFTYIVPISWSRFSGIATNTYPDGIIRDPLIREEFLFEGTGTATVHMMPNSGVPGMVVNSVEFAFSSGAAPEPGTAILVGGATLLVAIHALVRRRLFVCR